MMGLKCKTLSNNSKREILSLKMKEMVPTGIAENFSFTLQALSSHLWIKDQDLVAENMQRKNRFYSINKVRIWT